MEKTDPSPDFHPHMRPSQVHGDSGESRNQGGWRGGTNATQAIPPTRAPQFSYLGVPAAAGMSDCYESMARTPIRDRRITQPSVAPRLVPSHRRGRRSAPLRHSREGENPRTVHPRKNASRDTNNQVRVKTRPARESDAAASSPPLHCPASHHFHSLMRPSQSHGDSSESWNPEGVGRGKTTVRQARNPDSAPLSPSFSVPSRP